MKLQWDQPKLEERLLPVHPQNAVEHSISALYLSGTTCKQCQEPWSSPLVPKSILGLLPWFHSRNVRNNLQANPRDKARKRETCQMLITHLKHSKHNVLVETKGNPLDQGIKKSFSLVDLITPLSHRR
jgi:hypothetical protein